MSGYGANFAMVMDTEKVEALVEEPFAVFQAKLDDYNVTFDAFAEAYSKGDDIEIAAAIEIAYDIDAEIANEEITAAFQEVALAFKEKTGFSLNVEYHNQDENGADDDEVDGGFYFLLFDEVYQERPEATALNEIVPFGLRYYVNQG